MSLNFKIRALQWFNHIPALFGIYYVFYTREYYWLVISLISFLIIGVIATVVSLHRMLTHKAFKTYPWLEKFLSFITVYSTLGPSIAWVGVHRLHHATADTEKDPHSPHNGILKVWLGYGWNVENIPLSYVKDLMKSKLHRWMFDNYFKIIFATAILLTIIHPLLAVFVYFLPAVMTFHGTSAVNVLSHTHGYRNYDTRDKSTNSWIANIISLGDGWHNNHHRNPSNYYSGERWWEIDPCGWLIKLIKIN